MAYAKQLTKQDLINRFGIQDVSIDGTIIIGPKGINLRQHNIKSGKLTYKAVFVYDREDIQRVYRKRKYTDKNGNTKYYDSYTYKETTLAVHRIVYIWYNDIQHEGMVIDHIDNNQLNNNLDNLQEITPSENLSKDKSEDYNKVLKPSKCHNLRYMEEKLEYYTKLYEEAKANHDADKAHKLRTNISDWKAKIRYYKEHMEEYISAEFERKYQEELKRAKAERIHKHAEEVKKLKALIKHAHDKFKEDPNIETKYTWKLGVEVLRKYEENYKNGIV